MRRSGVSTRSDGCSVIFSSDAALVDYVEHLPARTMSARAPAVNANPMGLVTAAVHGTSVRRGRGFRCADSGDEVAGRGDENGEPHTECHYGVGAPVVAEDGQADEIDHR